MMAPTRRRDGFTLVEIMIASTILIMAVALAFRGLAFVMRGSQQQDIQNELDIEVQTAMELVKADLRLSSLSEMVFYPPNASTFTAISFPGARDDDGDGAVEVDADSKIIWDTTIVYHVWTTAPHQLRRTVFDRRNNDLTDAQRQQQLESVVVKGGGLSAPNGANASTTVVFENLFTWNLVPRGGTFDAYSESLSRAVNVNLGTISLTPGKHYFRFRSTGKNTASSGYKIGLDSLIVSPCGAPREAEAQLPVAVQYGSVALRQYMAAGSWDGNHQLYFGAREVGHYFVLGLDNDQWEETNFSSGYEERENTEVVFDKGIGTGDFVVQLRGMGTNWSASAQTGTNGVSTSAGELIDKAVRVVIRGGDSAGGGSLQFNGAKTAVNFRAGDASKPLKIRHAGIAERAPDSTNLMDAVAGTYHPITFGGGDSVSIAGGTDAWSDPLDFPIDESKTYLVTYLAGAGASEASAWKWRETIDAAATGSYLLPGAVADDIKDPTWSDRATVVAMPFIYGVQHVFSSYPGKGTITSRALDTHIDAPSYDAIDWHADVPSGAKIVMKVRTWSSNDMSDAAAWTNIVGQVSPGSITPDKKRYVQFQAEMYPDSTTVQSPVLKDVTLSWGGETHLVQVGGTFTTGPDYGIFELDVDGQVLRKGITVTLKIFDDTRGYAGTKTITSALTSEVWPRNTGK